MQHENFKTAMTIENPHVRLVTIQEMADLLIDISCTLMSSGSHTMRINQNVSRIAESFNYNVELAIFQHSIILTLTNKDDSMQRITLMRKNKPLLINFSFVAEISALSWDCFDKNLSFDEVKEGFEEIIQKKRLSRWIVLVLVGFANASFCGLFQGDTTAIGLVFLGTLAGFYARQELIARHLNHFMIFGISAFIASLISGLGYVFPGITATPEVAVAASVLYLVPGVPMINSALDIINGHILTGGARLINAFSLIACISLGMYLTMVILGLI